MKKWTKSGVFNPPLPDGFSQWRVPCITNIEGDMFALAFTSLDSRHRSHVFICRASVSDGTIHLCEDPKLVLSPGCLGHFDEDGTMTSCFTYHDQNIYLYYTGWQTQRNVPFTFGCGRAILDPLTLEVRRELQGPVLARDHLNPLLCAAPFVMAQHNDLVMWYVSGLRWENSEQGTRHFYTIRRAVSKDGLHWESDHLPCIPLNSDEYAIAKPSVLRDDERLCMWFCHRSLRGNTTYRIGLATSFDGVHWERSTEPHVLDVSAKGWDSGMVCYPYVFKHKGWLYMLYNGNDYGATGFGYAVLRD